MKNSSIIINLLADIAEGDHGAFSKFYDILYPTVYKFSRYFTKSEDLCKEIVSDVFYGLWQRRKSLTDIQNIESYIYTTVKHQAIKYKSIRIKHQGEPLELLPGEFFIETSTPENTMMNKEILSLLNSFTSLNTIPVTFCCCNRRFLARDC